MKAINYMSEKGDGSIHIDFSNIPDKGFIDATKTKNIASIRIMSKKEKLSNTNYIPGGPDVLVKYATGEKDYITRKQLQKEFVHSNGKRIILATLKEGRNYMVFNLCNEQYKIIKLPDNCQGNLPSGSQIPYGYYVVCKQNPDGTIDKNSIAYMSPSTFRKSFKIPMQPIIKKYADKNSRGSKVFKLFKKKRNGLLTHKQKNNINVGIDTSGFIDPNNIKIPSVNDIQQKETIKNTQNNINTQIQNGKFVPNISIKKDIGTKYKYRVTRRVVNMNGQLLGYEVQDMTTGVTKNLKQNELYTLCTKKLVENIMLVQNQSGNLYFKGNGCRISDLPQVIL